MKKIVIGIILVLLLASQAQAVQKAVMETKLIASEYGWLGDKVGYGDRYYKVTYDDGTSIIRHIKSGSLLPAYITSAPARVDIPVGGDPSGKFKVPVGLEGVSCTLSGSTSGNRHYLEFSYVGSSGYNAVIGGLFIVVPCGKIDNYFPYVDNYYIGAILNSPGDYGLKLTETVKLSSGTVVNDNRIFTVRVVGTTITAPTPISSSGVIRVASNVPATTYIDGKSVGITGNEFKVSAGGHDVTVSQNGYTTFTRTVTVDNGATIDVFATLTKITTGTPTPTPGSGSITVNSNIPGTVYIDGTNKGTTGNTFTVDAGGHDVKVTASGYNSYSTSITVDYGTTKVVDVTLITSSGGSGGATATATPATTTITGTPTTTGSVDITYGAGGGGITYRGVDIRFDNSAYYVGNIPHDSIAEAKKTIDEIIAGKEEKEQSMLDKLASYWLAIVIAAILGGYVLLSRKAGKGKKKK